MKVVITHTDLRIYWPARIAALQQRLESRGDSLSCIEISGAGSHYAFAVDEGRGGNLVRDWICLFPKKKMEDIAPSEAVRQLVARLDELRPDVVMAGSIAYPSGAAAVYWAKRNKRPVVIFDDIRGSDAPRNPLVNYIKRLLYRQVDAILCPARPWVEGWRKWGFCPEQVFFGVDVVDNGFWETSHKAIDPQRRQEPFLLAVGRQIPAKNFLFLLEGYAQLQREARHAIPPLLLIGDGPERPALEAFIRDHGLRDVYLLPFMGQIALRAYYQQAAALILPSCSETWGLVVNEAMAAGLPVLISKVCGCVPVLVKEGVNGFTFPPDDKEELVRVLGAFCRLDKQQREAMGAASRELIRPWDLDRFAEGSIGAIDFAASNRKVCKSFQARFVMRKWKGRYRPI